MIKSDCYVLTARIFAYSTKKTFTVVKIKFKQYTDFSILGESVLFRLTGFDSRQPKLNNYQINLFSKYLQVFFRQNTR